MVSVATAAARVTSLDARANAFRRLLSEDLHRYYALSAAMLGDVVEAQDAVHDAAISAWQRFGDLRDESRFAAWFDRILVNTCRDRLRARRRRPVADLGPTLTTTAASGIAADPSITVASIDAVDRALRSLDPDHLAVVILRYEADLTVAMIAARLGIAEGTVKSRLHYALRRMRDAMPPDEAG
jgi:RNA polymerase sigma-70 factor (ECF subfamily)